MLTGAFLSLALPLAIPQMWRPSYGVSTPFALYAQFNQTSPPSSNLWLNVVGTGAEQARPENAVTIEGPSELLTSNPEFAPATAAELISYQGLGDNWDGEGALAPSLGAIGSALRMLAAVPMQLEAPKPMVLASGDVAIYWDYGDTYAEIGFDDDGKYYAYAERPGFEPVHLNDISAEDEAGWTLFPMEVLELLTSQPLRAAA